MSKRTDKAYEKIMNALESPDQPFDELGDNDFMDIDKNFQTPDQDPEGKDWAPWEKEKEDASFAREEEGTYDHDGTDELKDIDTILDDQDLDGKKIRDGFEAFMDTDIANINEMYNSGSTTEGVLDFNEDRDGGATGKRAEDVSGTTDDDDNNEIRSGYIPEPNAELEDFNVDVSKELGGKDFPDSVTEAKASEILDQTWSEELEHWVNYVFQATDTYTLEDLKREGRNAGITDSDQSWQDFWDDWGVMDEIGKSLSGESLATENPFVGRNWVADDTPENASIVSAAQNLGITVEKAQKIADYSGMDLQAVVNAGNLDEMVWQYEQDLDEASRFEGASQTDTPAEVSDEDDRIGTPEPSNEYDVGITEEPAIEYDVEIETPEEDPELATVDAPEEDMVEEKPEGQPFDDLSDEGLQDFYNSENHNEKTVDKKAEEEKHTMWYDKPDKEDEEDDEDEEQAVFSLGNDESLSTEDAASNPDADDYYDSGIVIIDEEPEIDDRNDIQNELAGLYDGAINKMGDFSDDIRGDTLTESKKNNEKLEHNDLEELSTEDGGSAGNIWACPECGFKTISEDEYKDHNSSHEALDEDNISVESKDFELLSQFK